MPRTPGSAVTIGVYDGVHLGHRRVLEDVCRIARESGLRSVAVTFDRHPASVVRPESAPRQLTGLPQRIELLHDAGIDEVKVIEFTPERAAESAEEFVEEVLVEELSTRVVVVGEDFHFGRERGGNVALLQKIGADRGFRVEPFSLVSESSGDDAQAVSSTRIRALIGEGRLDEAAVLLGRPHEVRGLLGWDPGDRNLAVGIRVPPDILLPPVGQYRALVGLVGAAGVPLIDTIASVCDDDGSFMGFRLYGLTGPGWITIDGPVGNDWQDESPVRVRFAEQSPPG